MHGSPTWVSEIYHVTPDRKRVIRTAAAGLEQAAQGVAQDLLDEGLFGIWKKAPAQPPLKYLGGGAPEKAIWVVAELAGGRIRIRAI